MQLLYLAGQALSGQHSFRISERMPLKEERVLSVGTIVQCSLSPKSMRLEWDRNNFEDLPQDLPGALGVR